MQRFFLFLVLWVFGASLALADASVGIAHLMEVLRVNQTIQIMRLEGLKFGEELGQDMLPGGGGAPWAAEVSALYDTDKMVLVVERELSASLAEVELEPILAFYESPLGQRILTGEIKAREDFLNLATEDAARADFAKAQIETDPRWQQIESYIVANDLIEYNVIGAMNSSFMFYRGLTHGGLLEMTESDMLAEAWATEEQTRQDTREWMFAYLGAAYADLSVDELGAYTSFAKATAGQELNRALFAGYDRMYAELSLALGVAIAVSGSGEDL